jgi:hypothetical protein
MKYIFKLDEIRSIIYQFESIFIKSQNLLNFDIDKINAESDRYDILYDKKIRENFSDFVYLADEILLINKFIKEPLSNKTSNFEEMVFSASFYRNFLFNAHTSHLREALLTVVSEISNIKDIFEKKVTDKAYLNTIKKFDYFPNPKTKKELIRNISIFENKVDNCLQQLDKFDKKKRPVRTRVRTHY